MQSEAEKKASPQDESINFRPSPNFKHMKKYLKSKFEEENSVETSNMSGPEENHNKQEKVYASVAEVHPPLPPNPPPPDTPVIKQEVEEEQSQQNEADSYLSTTSETLEPAEAGEQASGNPEVTMCRNYVRGTCKKGPGCIYVHRLILSQLPGVYTFCRNFQNRQCTHQKCKFVHATVFEKENFFRTGYLPPHTTHHLRQLAQPAPPPPPPPPPQPPLPPQAPTEPVQQVMAHVQPNPAPNPGFAPVHLGPVAPPVQVRKPFRIGVAAPFQRNFSDDQGKPVQQIVNQAPPDPATFGMPPVQFRHVAPPAQNNLTRAYNIGVASPLKRSHSDETDVFDIPLETDKSKRCKMCDTNELRSRESKERLKALTILVEELKMQYNDMLKKHHTLMMILNHLFKPPNQPGLLDDEGIIEQILLAGKTRRLSPEAAKVFTFNEENLVKIFGPPPPSNNE